MNFVVTSFLENDSHHDVTIMNFRRPFVGGDAPDLLLAAMPVDLARVGSAARRRECGTNNCCTPSASTRHDRPCTPAICSTCRRRCTTLGRPTTPRPRPTCTTRMPPRRISNAARNEAISYAAYNAHQASVRDRTGGRRPREGRHARRHPATDDRTWATTPISRRPWATRRRRWAIASRRR